MAYGLEVPKVHEVSKYIEKNLDAFPSVIKENISKIKEISRSLKNGNLPFMDWRIGSPWKNIT